MAQAAGAEPGACVEPSVEELSLSKAAKALCFTQKLLPER